MIIIGQIAWIIRAIGYGISNDARMCLFLEIFHGITFGLVWSAAVHIASESCPVGMESTMQSLLDITYNGIGPAIGSIIGGYLFDTIGSAQTFLIFCAVCMMSLGLFAMLYKPHSPMTGQS